ncbi:S8 family serine peptidase [Nocardioides nanhaiensis]|uniref:S8 family serine peptidase n=1 Tax=Nocardioides nanhaiensis TaxID=1476871 RepID=UPI0031E6B84C
MGLLGPVASAEPGSGPAAADQPTSQSTSQATATESRGQEKSGPVISLGEGKGRELYIVQLDRAAVPSQTVGGAGARAENRTYRTDGSTERAYRRQIVADQGSLRQEISQVTGRKATPTFTYTEALNGFALPLTRTEAAEVAELDGVSGIWVDFERELQTDRGPEWIGAPSIWDGSATPSGEGNKGEGIVAGIIDSGINPANPSFADSVSEADGGDGYDHTNPLGKGNYVGVCNPTSAVHIPRWGCNDKLIGAWDFTPADSTNPYDEDGHGTHTGSTTAGNQVEATTYSAEEDPAERFSATRTIKGVAPHANVIAYDVCSGGCPGTAIIAGIDQAIKDKVDVINYSIGAEASSNPWTDPDAVGFLNARAAGIHVATSAGNSGPGGATVGAPADVPWITSVGATQHDRQWRASVQDLTAEGGATHPDIEGLAFANATDGSFPIVDAAALDAPLCQTDELEAADVEGKIVVCDRGGNGRVEKGQVLAELGAAGMILANDEASGDSLNADPHALPAVHITYDDGVELRTWMESVEGEQGSLSGGTEYIGDDVADIMAGFSSRGPNGAVELISPSISAPGVDILAANGVANEVSWGFISGTSMASPHVAGALALVAAENPDWTPAEAQSAIMTTAVTEVTDNDGTAADWFDMGSGRVDLTKAADAGLVLDVTEAEYLAANPVTGGDVTALNTASMAEADCLQICSWTRTVEATETGAGTWTAEGVAVTDGIDVTIEPASFDLAAGESQEITITADVTGSSVEDYQFGNVVLTPGAGSDAPAAHLPVAALPANGALPDEIVIDTRSDEGSEESDPIRAVEITDLDIEANGLVPSTIEDFTIPLDTTNPDPFDGNGVGTTTVQVPEGATRLIVNLKNATAPDFDLYVGKGTTPSAATAVAASASGGSAESIDLALGEGDEGPWWILVQNWEASASGTDTVDVESAVVAGDEGNLTAEGPETNPLNEPFTITTSWDEPAMEPGQTWYGSLSLYSAPGGTFIGTLPVTINRLGGEVVPPQPGADPKVNVVAQRNAREPRTDGLVVFRRPAAAKGERVTVTYKVRGSAKQGRDIRFMDRKVTFAKGATTAREVVRVVNRPGRQGPRTVRIVVVPGSGYAVGPKRTALVKVLDAGRGR